MHDAFEHVPILEKLPLQIDCLAAWGEPGGGSAVLPPRAARLSHPGRLGRPVGRSWGPPRPALPCPALRRAGAGGGRVAGPPAGRLCPGAAGGPAASQAWACGERFPVFRFGARGNGRGEAAGAELSSPGCRRSPGGEEAAMIPSAVTAGRLVAC